MGGELYWPIGRDMNNARGQESVDSKSESKQTMV
jgi:hypothetical protein